MAWMIGVDVGGTFTDFFAFDDTTDRIVLHKVPSTPANPALAVISGLRELGARHGIDLDAITRLSHGTTVATNALIQRRGGKVALVVTEGFRDLIEIGRQIRPHVFSLQDDYPAPLVPRELRFEAPERITADGKAIRALSPDTLPALVQAIGEAKPDACAVCLLFSFLNPAHEAMIGDALEGRLSGHVPVDLVAGAAGVPRIRAALDHGAERLSAAGDRPLSRRFPERRRASRAEGRARHQPVVRRADVGRARAPHADPHRAVGAGGGRGRRDPHGAALGRRRRHFARHGRHQRGRRADAQLHRRHDLQQMDRGLSGAARLDGHQRGRRRRRLDRVVRPRRADENGPAERGRAAGPGLLRARRHRGHGHRREPRARAVVAERPARRRHGARRKPRAQGDRAARRAARLHDRAHRARHARDRRRQHGAGDPLGLGRARARSARLRAAAVRRRRAAARDRRRQEPRHHALPRAVRAGHFMRAGTDRVGPARDLRAHRGDAAQRCTAAPT